MNLSTLSWSTEGNISLAVLSKTRKSILLLFAFIITGIYSFAQTASDGDYRTRSTGALNWSGTTTWQVRASASWANTTTPPTAANNVYIQAGSTVTVDVATVDCKDIHVQVTTGVLSIGANTVRVSGKLRAYTGTAVFTTGVDGTFYTQTSSTNPNATFITSTAGTGKLSFIGNTRAITVSGEFGATSTGFDMDISLNSGQTATPGTNMKAANWTMTSGILDCSTTARVISADNGTTGGNVTVSSGFVWITAGVPLLQRSGSSSAAALNLNSGAILRITAQTPTIAATTLNLNGTVEYTRAAIQTLATAVQGGANPNTYNNLTLGGTSAKTLGLATTVNGTLSLQGTASLALGGFGLTYGSTSTLEYAGSATQTATTTEFPSSGGPNSLQINNTNGFRLPFSRTIAGDVKVLAGDVQNLSGTAVTLTMSGASPTLQVNGSITGTNVGAGNDINLIYSNTTGTLSVTGTGSLCRFLNVTVTNSAATLALSRGLEVMFGAFTENGILKINNGGFVSSAVNAVGPTYGASSTLIYNTGTTYGRGIEFSNTGSTPSNVQISGNTTLNYPNGGLAARTLTGNLTIDAGSAFYMDFGSPNPGVGLLTINNLVLNGNMSLGSQTGGDLVVKGNFTRTGTFSPVGRAVFFNAATGNQTLTGNTTFDYVIVDKAAGSVVLAGNMVVAQILTLTNGTVNTAANVVNLTNSGTGSLVRTNGYVNGNLQRAIATGTNTYLYAVGTATGYTPASFAFTGISGAGSITLASADAAGANYPAALNATKRLARNWTATNSGVTGIAGSATFTYLTPGDLAGGAVSGNLKAYVYNGSHSYPTSNSNTSNSFTYTGLTTVGEFGAGECKGTLAPTFTKTMASSCGGGADGSITVTPAGGTAPYTYSWTSNPSGFTASTAAITGLAPKDYTVVVTEVTTCSTSIPNITIWQALAPTITHSGSGSSSCGNTGSIILYAANGVAPFTYSIDGVTYQAGNTFTNVAGGTYTGYVKDLRNCITTKPGIVVTSAAAIVVTSNTRAASACANNGVIELYRTGGVAPYTYSLDDITYQGSNTFTNLAGATSYTGWVKDSKGCKTSLPGIAVGKATAVTATATHTNASACASDGTLTITGHGGTPGFTYSITGVNGTYQNSGTFTGLGAGSYTGWAQDSKGCKNFVGITITAAGGMTVTATASDAGGCNNAGKIQVFVSGGVGPYTYSLDNVGYVAGNTFTGLTAGMYTAYVKDSKGCVSSIGGINVTNTTTALSTTESHTQSSTCVNDGTIQLRPAGGVAPYTYSLDNITYQGTAYFTGLAPTSYTGWVKDANGCTASVSLSITANPIIITEYVTDPSNCAVADGKVQLFRTGGTGPYTYSMDNVTYQSGNTFTGLLAGTYTFYVKDSKGCVGSLSVEVGPGCPPGIATNRGNTSAKVSVSNALKVQAYPNPTATEFTLKLEGNSNAKVSITVTDLMGRNVLKLESAAGKLIRFGNELKAGVYLVQVMQGGEMQSVKLVKE